MLHLSSILSDSLHVLVLATRITRDRNTTLVLVSPEVSRP